MCSVIWCAGDSCSCSKEEAPGKSRKKANFLSFSHPLSAELFTPWGEVLHCSILQWKVSLQKHIQLLACCCCFSLASQAKLLTTLLHLAFFSPSSKIATAALFPFHICFPLMTAQKVYQNGESFAVSATVCHDQAQ